MKRLGIWLMVLCLLATGLAGCGSQGDRPDEDTLLKGKHYAEIMVTGYGAIVVELDADVAPITVTNFCNLAKSGFYDGLTFHRIINGFMMQGGDPDGDGIGGSDKTITGEFSANGISNHLSHTRGTISMARTNDPDSASSQFFIVHQDSTYLDGNYAAFGHVVSGMEVVDAVCVSVPVTDSNGTVVTKMRPVMEYIRVLEEYTPPATTTTTAASTTRTPTTTTAPDTTVYLSGIHTAEITIRDYGVITVELNADAAPITVTNFCALANNGFYDGVSFHRIIDGFMMQGGDPDGDGIGGSDKTITGEFSLNGIDNPISHSRGTISMARTNNYNSASSQFFIVHQDSTYLDGQYAAFGHVISGMDVVDAICTGTPVQDSNGLVAVADRPIMTSVRILD